MQIWIMPNKAGIAPAYGQKSFDTALRTHKLVHVASADSREDTIGLQQDADVYIARPQAGDCIEFPVRPKRGVWTQVLRGAVRINGQQANAGDGVAAENEAHLEIIATEAAEFILFDLG